MNESLKQFEHSAHTNPSLTRVMEGGSRFSHVAFFEGATLLEPVTSQFFRLTQVLRSQPREQTGFPTNRNIFKRSIDSFLEEIEKAGFSVSGLDMFDEYLQPDFKIGHYGKLVDEELTKLARLGELEVVIGNSAGTSAVMWAVGMRIKRTRNAGYDPYDLKSPPNYRLPKLLIFIDPIFDGLTIVAQTYLDLIRQLFPLETVPGLEDMFVGSHFLDDLSRLIEEVSDDLPLTIILNGQAGEGYVACPFAAVARADFDPVAKKLGIEAEIEAEFELDPNGNDGMCKEGTVKNLWPKGRRIEMKRLGNLHIGAPYSYVGEVIEILAKKELRGDLLSELPNEFIVDNRQNLNQNKNKLLGKLMLFLFKLMLKKLER